MDSLTHIVLGAAIGEALLGKEAGKKAMLWGAIAASAPDIDAVLSFFVSDIDSLVLHRGITHSLFLAMLIGPLWGWITWKYHQCDRLRTWIIMITSNIMLHDLLDTCTVYGTGLLTPFTQYRFSFDNIFVADPLYTIPLLISFFALLIIKRSNSSRKKWNAFGLIASSAYMLLTFYNHNKAVDALQASLNTQGIKSEKHFAAPTLFNTFLWNVVAKDSTGFWIGYYSVFDKDKNIKLNYFPQNKHLLGDWSEKTDIKNLVEFTKGFYVVSEKDGNRWINDLRFGQVGGWENPNGKFAFAFDLTEEADNTMVVQQGRIEGSTRTMLLSLVTRIRGN